METEYIELADILQEATEEKINIPLPDMEQASPDPAQTFVNDFDENVLNDANATDAENIADETQRAMYDSAQLSPLIVDGAEMLIKQVFPVLYEKSAFTKDELIGMKAFAYKQRMQTHRRETVIEPGDEKFAAMVEEYETYINSLPFTDLEKKSIIQPLKEVLKDVNYQTSPGNALIIAVGLVMLPRAMPVVSKKFFESKDDKK